MIINIPENDSKNYKQLIFPAGENHVQLLNLPKEGEPVNILYRYTGDNSILILLQVTDAVRRCGVKEINLFIPYFPGARQDRVCNEGEALSVKVYANLINSQGYNKVVVFDPHSEVTPALIESVRVVKNHEFVKHALRDIETIYRDEFIKNIESAGMGIKDIFFSGNINDLVTPLVLISPDAGANKKVFKLSSYLGGLNVVRADKTRDTTTGKLSNPTVYADNLDGKICVVVDDIISYAGTFKNLSIKLKEKGAEKVYLIISHNEGVFDEKALKDSGIDKVFTTNSLARANETEFTKIYDVFRFMN